MIIEITDDMKDEARKRTAEMVKALPKYARAKALCTSEHDLLRDAIIANEILEDGRYALSSRDVFGYMVDLKAPEEAGIYVTLDRIL